MKRPAFTPASQLPRRAALGRMLALAAALAGGSRSAAAQALRTTPQDAEGPFYPRKLPASAGPDLTRIPGREGIAKGTLLYLAGTVKAADGAPLAGAQLELWQCDVYGTYHHVGASGQQDENFQGYGRATADAQGHYAFKTIRPVPYSGRPAHLHFRIGHPQAGALTTQLYIAGESAERGIGGMFARDRDRLEIRPAAIEGREPGALAASYDFVLAKR